MKSGLLLVANPGSASRKYSLFKFSEQQITNLAAVHFEINQSGRVVYSVSADEKTIIHEEDAGISHLTFSATRLLEILNNNSLIPENLPISAIGLRIVAPSSAFTKHRVIDHKAIDELNELLPRASLHISASLQEINLLQKEFPKVKIVGASDSAFHTTIPDYARTYGIDQKLAKKMDVWRFGYHGLSVGSAVNQLSFAKKLPQKLVICHLGSGSSVTAVKNGISKSNTMGYSPNEGLIMATRTGSIDPAAVFALQQTKTISSDETLEYLNTHCGLIAISGKSSDIRELLSLEQDNDELAGLALDTYVHHVSAAIGQMAAILNGFDALVFTGTIGERSSVIRKRVCSSLDFLGVEIDSGKNLGQTNPVKLTSIQKDVSKEIIVLPANEAAEIARITVTLL